MAQMDKESNRQLWIARICELGNSGMTQKDWCRAKNISESTLRYWIRKLRSEAVQETSVDWLQVDITEETRIANVKTQEPRHSDNSGVINIRCGEFTVELQNGCDPQRVYEVLRMLKAL